MLLRTHYIFVPCFGIHHEVGPHCSGINYVCTSPGICFLMRHVSLSGGGQIRCVHVRIYLCMEYWNESCLLIEFTSLHCSLVCVPFFTLCYHHVRTYVCTGVEKASVFVPKWCVELWSATVWSVECGQDPFWWIHLQTGIIWIVWWNPKMQRVFGVVTGAPSQLNRPIVHMTEI